MRLAHNVGMEIRELTWFTTLAETEHVTAASEQLNVSQPTLSRALARLERRLGVQLFDRRQNRLHLNKYGEIYRAHALRAANDMHVAEDRIRSLTDPDAGVITLGFLHSYGGWLVPRMMRSYLRRVPRARFDLRGAAADSVADDVRRGRIDLGVVGPRPIADDLRWDELGRERLTLSVPAGHPLAGHERINLSDLEDEVFVALKPEYGLRQVGDELCDRAGFRPTIACETTELSTMLGLVAAGIGIALTPAARTRFFEVGTIVDVPISDDSAFRAYGVVSRPQGPGGRAAQRFLDFASAGDDAFHA